MDRSMARDRPSPYEEGGRFVKKMSGYRSAGACPPRTLERASDSEGQVFPPPYEEGGRFVKKMSGYRSAGACPPRALECTDDGEGQALALR